MQAQPILMARYSLSGKHRSMFAVCPQCQSSLERDFQSYCDRCGQKLDWKLYPHKVKVEVFLLR